MEGGRDGGRDGGMEGGMEEGGGSREGGEGGIEGGEEGEEGGACNYLHAHHSNERKSLTWRRCSRECGWSQRP